MKKILIGLFLIFGLVSYSQEKLKIDSVQIYSNISNNESIKFVETIIDLGYFEKALYRISAKEDQDYLLARYYFNDGRVFPRVLIKPIPKGPKELIKREKI